jgi:UDP-N-acetylmuramate dehydrogenase
MEEGVSWRVMGNGSNLLVRDEGVRGLVLRIRRTLDHISVDPPGIEVGAGFPFPNLTREAARNGLAGLEFGAGIPGTVGGALVMNAGWHQHEIGNVVETVDYLDESGTETVLDRAACGFGYRSSRFRKERGIVLSARLRLLSDDADAILARMEEYASSRKRSQPTELPSCGSVFLQPEGDYAGRLIDRAGLKGLRAGAIQVSEKHANFFVNLGGGTAADALALVERVEEEVLRRFGVRLQREFDLW